MADKTLKECLVETRALLARKGGWIQHDAARDAKGKPIDAARPEAVKFCLIGALSRACGPFPDSNHPALLTVLRCIQKQRGASKEEYISLYNDRPHRKKSQVLKVMDCAIAEADAAK